MSHDCDCLLDAVFHEFFGYLGEILLYDVDVVHGQLQALNINDRLHRKRSPRQTIPAKQLINLLMVHAILAYLLEHQHMVDHRVLQPTVLQHSLADQLRVLVV